MRTINKKIIKKYFELIASGEKRFEVRLNDFECDVGDLLVLREWDSQNKQYTGRSLKKEITYISTTKNQVEHWPKQDIEDKGLLIMSLGNIVKKDL